MPRPHYAIFHRIIDIPKLEKKHTLLQFVTGEPVTVDGVTGISFKIAGISITHTFYVVPTLLSRD